MDAPNSLYWSHASSGFDNFTVKSTIELIKGEHRMEPSRVPVKIGESKLRNRTRMFVQMASDDLLIPALNSWIKEI